MPLSEYEQRMLDELEQSLVSDDPKLTAELGAPEPRRAPRHLLLSVLSVLAGVVVLVVGLAVGQPLVGLGGFILVFVAVAWIVMSRPAGQPDEPSAQAKAEPSAAGAAAKQRRAAAAGWSARMEERWRRRHGDSER